MGNHCRSKAIWLTFFLFYCIIIFLVEKVWSVLARKYSNIYICRTAQCFFNYWTRTYNLCLQTDKNVQCKNGKMIHSNMCCTFSAKHAYCRTTKQDKKKSDTNSKIKWKKYITLYISESTLSVTNILNILCSIMLIKIYFEYIF